MKQSVHTTSPLILGGRILFVTFGIIYTLFFSLAPNKDAFAQPVTDSTQQTGNTGSEDKIMRLQIEQSQDGMLGENDQIITPQVQETEPPLPALPRTPKHIVSTQELFFGKKSTTALQNTSVQNTVSDILGSDFPGMLSFPGTHHWRGTMKSALLVGFASSIKYVLKNNENTHFAYLGNDLPDISEGVIKLSGKTVAFTDKKDINTHGLFGDKVIFLQIPQYLGKKQLFFVYFSQERDRWFIQVDDDIFETTKPLLRELFAKRYNR